MTHHPEYIRKCSDCVKYVFGENGKIGTYPAVVDGRRVELPQLRADVKCQPPCKTCPKVADQAEGERRPIEESDGDFGDWFDGCIQLYREGRAVGFGEVDLFMRKVFAEIDGVIRGAERAEMVKMMLAGK